MRYINFGLVVVISECLNLIFCSMPTGEMKNQMVCEMYAIRCFNNK